MDANECRIDLVEATKHPRLSINGRRVNWKTIWRWAAKGTVRSGKRFFLESDFCGGRRVTSAQAVDRFLDRLNSDVRDDGVTATEATRRQQRAKSRLAAAGI